MTAAVSIFTWFLKCQFGSLSQTRRKIDLESNLIFFSTSNLIFTACVAYKNQFRNQIDFLIFHTWYFEIEKNLSDIQYFKNQVEIDRGCVSCELYQRWLGPEKVKKRSR